MCVAYPSGRLAALAVGFPGGFPGGGADGGFAGAKAGGGGGREGASGEPCVGADFVNLRPVALGPELVGVGRDDPSGVGGPEEEERGVWPLLDGEEVLRRDDGGLEVQELGQGVDEGGEEDGGEGSFGVLLVPSNDDDPVLGDSCLHPKLCGRLDV